MNRGHIPAVRSPHSEREGPRSSPGSSDESRARIWEDKPGTKQRLLFLRRAPWFWGAEIRLLDWLRGIDYAKYTVLLAYKTDVFSSRVKSLGLPVVCTPLTVPVEGRFWKVFFSWLSYLRQIRADKIIMGDGYFGEWPLATVLAA